MPRADKWQLVGLVGMIVGGTTVVIADAGSVSVWWLLLMLFNIGVQCWDL
ncbi:hypothetical protein ACYSUO_23435 [Streptomyces sp. UC4497]